jgi:hypothetical protein
MAFPTEKSAELFLSKKLMVIEGKAKGHPSPVKPAE